MAFTFTKNMGKTNVWYNEIFIGQVDVVLQKNMDLDWPYDQEGGEIDVEKRWDFYYIAIPTLKPFGEELAGLKFETREEASQAILDYHRRRCQKEAISNAV